MALKEKKGKIVLASIRMVSILIIAIAAIFVTYRLTKKDEPEITNTFISEKLEAVSELTTAKLTYTGLVRYTEGNIPFLTKKEFNLLWFLMSNSNQVFTRDELLSSVWEDDVLVVDRTIDVNINRLRKKLGEYGNKIFTKSGYGYGFKTHD